jgi:uncharacterized Zn-finger protein
MDFPLYHPEAYHEMESLLNNSLVANELLLQLNKRPFLDLENVMDTYESNTYPYQIYGRCQSTLSMTLSPIEPFSSPFSSPFSPSALNVVAPSSPPFSPLPTSPIDPLPDLDLPSPYSSPLLRSHTLLSPDAFGQSLGFVSTISPSPEPLPRVLLVPIVVPHGEVSKHEFQNVKQEVPNRYVCKHPSCGKAFLSRFSLKRHGKLHTGERPHKCEVCGKGFAEKSGLKRHDQKHTGEKPFKCDATGCPKKFADKANLVRHVQTKHKSVPSNCESPQERPQKRLKE